MQRFELMAAVAPILVLVALLSTVCASVALADGGPDLTHATLVVRDAAAAPLVERTAAVVLIEETEKRSGVKWTAGANWPTQGWAIAVTSGKAAELQGRRVPDAARIAKREGYGIETDTAHPDRPVLWIVGADPRGALFGVGRVLRNLACGPGAVRLIAPLNLTSSPDYPIRGHQLGYRATANSYDAWSPAQFDQYIRELALFGTNTIEGIPFEDDRPTVNSYPRSKMNVDISRICERYGQDYSIWAPADFDLRDAALRAKALREHEALYRECPELSAVFVAGGDPGDNPAELVIPYLEDLSNILARFHPRARVWLSMQDYSGAQQDYVYRWLEREHPKWLGGLVAGPGSIAISEMRARIPKQYPLRDYPDITHIVRCQFPVPWLDPAYAFTLGRECVNPRPLFYARVIRDTAPFTDGFISYSDGIHDDVNKVLWSALAWDRSADLNTILTEYCRLFFGPDIADTAAAGLFAFERDWDGALATNGGVDATFALWRGIERRAVISAAIAAGADLQASASHVHVAVDPEMETRADRAVPFNVKSNWRWQICLLRAYYDMYTRHRLIYESQLEDEANAAMLTARAVGSERAIDETLRILKRAETAPVYPDLAARIVELCDELYRSIGLQTSVAKYHASGSERGCVLDFLNYPLNNRWWLEDELAKVRKMSGEDAKVARLETPAKWEHPGPGSFYDDIGNIAKSPHEVRNEKLAAPLLDVDNMSLPGIMFWVENDPLARARQSWFTDEAWPTALKYQALDPQADYVVRTTGCGDCFLRVNGLRMVPTLYGKKVGEIKEFPVPRGLYRDGNITLTFDPTFEPSLNWRVQSRLSEVWLIKK